MRCLDLGGGVGRTRVGPSNQDTANSICVLRIAESPMVAVGALLGLLLGIWWYKMWCPAAPAMHRSCRSGLGGPVHSAPVSAGSLLGQGLSVATVVGGEDSVLLICSFYLLYSPAHFYHLCHMTLGNMKFDPGHYPQHL